MSPYDRTGDPDGPDPQHRPGIDCAPGGWLPGHTPDDDQPRPCLHCRPALRPDERRRRIWGTDPGPHPDPRSTK